MADDRIYLQCRACGERLFLGKQFGWGAFYWQNYGKINGDDNSPSLEERLNRFFEEHIHPESESGNWYGNYNIVYETDNCYEDKMWNPADVVEVVRCKECAYYDKHIGWKNADGTIDYSCGNFQLFMSQDFFCKWGERRECENEVAR